MLMRFILVGSLEEGFWGKGGNCVSEGAAGVLQLLVERRC